MLRFILAFLLLCLVPAAPSDRTAIQYVARGGSSGADGSTWETAKSSVAEAYAALPPCSVEGKSWNHCGDIEIGAGMFTFPASVKITSPFVWIRGRGTVVTALKYTGIAGCALSWTADPLNAASGDSYAGGLFDLTLESPGPLAGSSPWPLGFNAAASPHLADSFTGVCGLETRDIEGFQMRGVEIAGFANGACWWDHTVYDWNERYKISAEFTGCGAGWFIDAEPTAINYPRGTTFGYGNFDLWINPTSPGEIGVLQSAGSLDYSDVHIIENTAAYTTAFVLTDSAEWGSDLINFHFEGVDPAMGVVLAPGAAFSSVGVLDSALPASLNGTYSVLPIQ